MTDTAAPPAFRVAQIFMLGAMFRHRGNPLARPPATAVGPQQIAVSIGMEQLNDGEAFQVRVAVSTNPEDGDEKAVYDFGLEYAALVDRVDRERFANGELAEIVATMTFPFLREAVANITSRGRFGPIWLNPFNVHEALAKAEERRAAGVGATKNESPTS